MKNEPKEMYDGKATAAIEMFDLSRLSADAINLPSGLRSVLNRAYARRGSDQDAIPENVQASTCIPLREVPDLRYMI